MAAIAPPKPPELAAKIIHAVWQHVEFDNAPIRRELRRRLKEPSDEYIWPRAEDIAADEISTVWAHELVEQCERSLEAAGDDLAALGADVEAIEDDLTEYGRESWIAKAIRHQIAFEAAWDVITRGGSKVIS